MRFKSILYVVCASLTGASFSADAALVTGDVLEFVPGTQVWTIGAIPPLCDSGAIDIAGSYYAMNTDGDGTFNAFEKFTISMHDGIKISIVQPALGSHTGVVNGTEMPSIDNPWNSKNNTGMHQSLRPITEVAPGLLDFSGWGISWNVTPILLGGDPDNFPGDTGLTTITCSTLSCSHGNSYVLDYSGHVTLDGSSGFGGVYYSLHLEGVVSAVPVPATIWLFRSGVLLLAGTFKRKAHKIYYTAITLTLKSNEILIFI